MEFPKLIINSETEFSPEKPITSIGRTPDNDISFSGDTNVSRFHAEIEKRGDEYWIIDLNSSNGTTVDGEKLTGEMPLADGAVILLGGTSQLEFLRTPKEDEPKEEEDEPEKEKEEEHSGEEAATPKKRSKTPIIMLVAAMAVSLALIVVVGTALFFLTREKAKCNATATIVKPTLGESIKTTTQIEVNFTNIECVKKVSYRVENEEFASSTETPFSASIDPEKFPQFADGLNRNLKAVLFDANGTEISESPDVAFYVETIEVSTPTPTETPTGTQPQGGSSQQNTQNAPVSVGDTLTMSTNIVKQFTGNNQYKFDQKFLTEVQQRTAEYVSAGYFARAAKYRDTINVSFIRENSLDPPLGYLLAMSRSKFIPKADGNGVGLWQINPQLVKANAYDGLCGTETIDAAAQNCAAKATARYLKDLVVNVFGGDTIYGVAAFGMTPSEAEAWKNSLPANRADFWNVIKSNEQRQQIVNFFAAAAVAENPQKFGLKQDRPLSELYSVFMK